RRGAPGTPGLGAALHAVRRTAYLARAAALADHLQALRDDPSAVAATLAEVRATLQELHKLREEYASLWAEENRPWWLERNLAKFDQAEGFLRALLEGPIVLPFERVFLGETEVRIVAAQHRGPIRYTLDGSDPDENSPTYSGPIRLSATTTVKGRVGDGPVAQATFRTTTVPARLSTDLAAYEGNVLFHVLDGDPETFFWSFGPPPPGAHVTAEFLRPQRVRRIRVLTGQPWNPAGDRMHQGVVEVLQGGSWRKVADFVDGSAEAALDGSPVEGVRLRSLRNPGFWLVVREILLETD
ncbi:MAG: chitobiase/beta-hexosaminidase C-terminal domain-containing protein, partial [Fimbriimonadales bacterium]